MVGEFPELQGHMGRAYARHGASPTPSPTPSAITTARRRARFGCADDVSAIVALADRLDTLAGASRSGSSPRSRRSVRASSRLHRDAAHAARQGGRQPALREVGSVRDGQSRLPGYGDKLRARAHRPTRRRSHGPRSRTSWRARARAPAWLIASATSAAVADAVLAGVCFVDGEERAVARHPVYRWRRRVRSTPSSGESSRGSRKRRRSPNAWPALAKRRSLSSTQKIFPESRTTKQS